MIYSNQRESKFLYKFNYGLMIIALIACTEKSAGSDADSGLSANDIEQINQINKDYTQGWLENDSVKVLGLYADSATIIPSGLLPIHGKKAISDFWFPNDGSKTMIHYYDLKILAINGTGNFAYTYENGKLSFSYEKEDFKLDRQAESHAVTIYKKGKLQKWKIVKRIWTDLNK